MPDRLALAPLMRFLRINCRQSRCAGSNSLKAVLDAAIAAIAVEDAATALISSYALQDRPASVATVLPIATPLADSARHSSLFAIIAFCSDPRRRAARPSCRTRNTDPSMCRRHRSPHRWPAAWSAAFHCCDLPCPTGVPSTTDTPPRFFANSFAWVGFSSSVSILCTPLR